MNLNLFDQFVATPSTGTDGRKPGSAKIAGLPVSLTGGLAAGSVLGLLAGNKKMRKQAKKWAGTTAGIGGAAALGALAYGAYRNWQTGNPVHPQAALSGNNPLPTRFDPDANTASDGQPFQIVLVKAMIAAANADGHIDAEELRTIREALEKTPLETGDQALIFDTLQDPPGIDVIAAYADGIEQASEIYLASRLAIDPDHPAEIAYMQQLADKLSLPRDLVQHLEGEIAVPEPRAA